MDIFNIIILYSLGTIQGILISIAVIYLNEKGILNHDESGD